MNRFYAILLLGLILTLTGCSQNTGSSVISQDTTVDPESMPPTVHKLMDDYDLPTDSSEYELIADIVANDPDLNTCDYDIYAVTFLWGHLFNLSALDIVPTDWSGSLWVNGEAIVTPRITIDFEPGEDSLVTDNLPYTAEWVSHTTGDFDGISFLVFLKRGVVYIVPPTLHYDTSPLALEFAFDELEHLFAFYPVDNINAVAVHSRKIWPQDCPQGLISGEWVKEQLWSTDGYFYALWLDDNSTPLGYLSGIWRTENDGQQLFSGSLSGYVTDEVIAEVRGIWYYDDLRMCPVCGVSHGVFRGRFQYLVDGRQGTLKGVFGDYSLSPEDVVLPMTGTWQNDCIQYSIGDLDEAK
ncbi:MAG: hypothetical protein KOO62_13490 [candidate division Zixibacteria bacterium]|nr:hypothetical protein [candidate division Zixibacteria bacterium]